MNHHCVPGWNTEDQSRSSHDLLPASAAATPESELVELLWRDGHVIMQNPSKPSPFAPEPNFDPSSWFRYPFHDPLEEEFAEFFSGIPGIGGAGIADESIAMPPPEYVDVSSYPRLPTEDLRSGIGAAVGVGESSACGSNQADANTSLLREGTITMTQTATFDPMLTSSTSGSSDNSVGGTIARQTAGDRSIKRKARDAEDSEYQSEDAEYESVEANLPKARRNSTTRKSRAAEVHNLSERRRRDRINEKMKALQELIPHCNKSDKASMLDEAIAYLKSLQIQLQIMWMGSGMAPMMFPVVHQYVSPSSNDNPVQLPRIPMPSAVSARQVSVCQSLALNPVDFPALLRSARMPESHTHYVGFPHAQLTPQATNLYAYEPQMSVDASGSLPTAGIPSENK